MRFISYLVLVLFGLGNMQAQQIAATYYNQEAGDYNVGDDCVAVQGYDLVAYHNENKATKGLSKYQYTIDGIHYFFSSEDHKTLFESQPENYLPAYGGFCAFGLGMPNGFGGSLPGKYPINPETFKIVNGRLYLFYHQDGFDALRLWEKAEDRIKKMADLRWQHLTRK
ncbi:MAG: YHS domain-containing (seleno)protein [Flavobacteriaceae bacterium]